jgi:hypothetical protein
MAANRLGRLTKVDPRDVWKDESVHFTPWLAQDENLALLGETLGMQLELVEQEKPVGRFVADILCKDLSDDSWVVIENQLEKTDHSHLGQILTYAAGLEAATLVWITPEFTEEHRAALDWLNEHTDEKTSFLGLEVELWRIGESAIAPKFHIVAKPNDWTREVRATAARGELTEHKRLQLEFWTAFKDYMDKHSKLQCRAPRPQHWMDFTVGRTGVNLAAVATLWDTESQAESPHVRVELDTSGKKSKMYFDELELQKTEIERQLGQTLSWRAAEEGQRCRVYLKRPANLLNRAEWPNMHEWLKQNLELFYSVFGPRVKALDVGRA